MKQQVSEKRMTKMDRNIWLNQQKACTPRELYGL